jgi:multimeric flavodoxin WrbA
MADILAIGGSPRRGGNTDALVKAAAQAATESGAVVETVFLRNYDFRSCQGCEKCRRDKACTGLRDGMNLLYPLIEESRGLILASPVHNYNVTALVKAFIDRLYCYYDFDDERPRGWSSRLAGQDRRAGIMIVAEQPDEASLGVTMDAMRLPLEALGCEVKTPPPVLGVFDAGAVKKQDEFMARAADLGRSLL